MLVDNANIPEKGPIRDMLSWHPSAKLITEPQLGLTPARLKAIGEAAGDLFVLVDDDNVFDPDFLEQALSIMGDYPFLGSWSGQCCPEFEVPTPDWKRRYWVNLLIREFDADVWSNLPRLATTMPCGAGLCVRREVERRYLDLNKSGQRAFQLDRTGASLLSGGDNDLAACACDIGLMTKLKLVHLIPPQRLTVDYLARLAERIHHSGVVLAYLSEDSAELSSCRVGLRHWIRAAFQASPHRQLQLAALRGKRSGLESVASLQRIKT
jgi:hypothetical protein